MTDAPLTSSELGNLWQAFMEKSMALRVLEYFIETSNEPKEKAILEDTYKIQEENKNAITKIFQSEGAVVPHAFTEEDVKKNAPRLFGEHFDLMYIRTTSKCLMALYTLHEGMSYRKDIRDLYFNFTSDEQNVYNKTTEYLLEKGILARPPIVPMPTEVEFAKGTDYTNGFSLFNKKRVLNTVEIGLVYQSLETNTTGMQLMTGFAQVAKEQEVKKYFLRGQEYAKEQINIMGNLLLESDLPAPSTWEGTVTESTVSPFSDRLMMYNTNLLSMFGLGSNTVGASFSFRSDLLLKMARITANTFDFAKDGGEIMLKHGWTEQPPQAVDRKDLIHS
jgi:hypothetical protein